MDVGIRELKAKLSHYVARAAEGGTIIITDRGRPVAKLVGLDGLSNVQRGIEEGWIEPPRRTKLGPRLELVGRQSVMDALDEDRG